ncbi:MAG: glycosyltransferase family 4 protein [Polyangiaceae bacterium]
MTRRVLHLAGEFPPERIGGIATYLENLVRFAPRGTELAVVVASGESYSFDPPASSLKVRVQHVDLRPALDYVARRNVLSFAQVANILGTAGLLEEDWDLAHVHDWYGVLPACALRALAPTPMVMTAHLPLRRGFSYANHPLPVLQKSRLEALGFRLANRVLAPSRSIQAALEAEYDVDVLRTAVVPGGVDTGLFSPESRVSEGPPRLLVSCRLTEQKGVEHAIAAFAEVRRRHPEVELWIAGDGPARARLSAMVDELQVSGVRFLGWVAHHELPALYDSAQVVLAPSAYEPFGLSVLEAMSCGAAVIASPFGGAMDFVHHGENGLLCVPHRRGELASVVLQLLADDALRSRLGQQARATALQMTWDHTWSQLETQYELARTSS